MRSTPSGASRASWIVAYVTHSTLRYADACTHAHNTYYAMQMGNFHKDQVAMTTQLATIAHILKYLDPILHRSLEETDSLNMFFCFRWILLQFKREFSPADICEVWDAFWARSETEHFHLFFAVAAIESMRDKVISERMKFDELLRHVNELSGKFPTSQLLAKAMLHYRRFMDSAPAELQAKLSIKRDP